MENTGSVESNSEKTPMQILMTSSGEARAYIEALKVADDIDSLTALLKQVEGRARNLASGVGGEYDYQYTLYLIKEIKIALGLEPTID
ncbi:MAG: hypothetical protein V4611_04475 [Patescibacteria group bacterium]